MKGILLFITVCLLLAGFAAQAEVSEKEFDDLKAKYEDLAGKVDARSGSSWTDRVGISGDFRYRFERIDEDGKETRNRSRIRARTAIKAEMSDDVEIGFGLATGGNDPVSANVTLGGGGSSKEINLDLAYASWTGIDHAVITMGKFKNPLVRPGGNGMLWDGDWRPEGLTAGWDDGRFFGTAFGSWLEADSKIGTDFAWGLQGGWKGELSGASVTVGASYFDIGTQGRESLFGKEDDFFGNSFTCTDPVAMTGCTYDINYEEVEAFAEVGTKIAGQPVRFFADFVQNQDADTNDTGWSTGVKIGKAKDAGQWSAGYVYEDLEADAALGLTADSDFGGGGTDVKGHKLSAAYGLNKMTALKATYFINQIDAGIGNKHDYNRLQLDVQFKFH